jgi:hypothetical protein
MASKVRLAFAFAAAAVIVGCSAQGLSGLLPSNPQPALRSAPGAPVDIGRRNTRDPVSIVVLLRYNRQAELDRFADALARERSPRYLTAAQFMARFGPTPQQQAQVVQILRRAGFAITRTYPNRTLVDASAPSGTVERFFSTQIHNFRQARYGVRFANVRPMHVPAQLAALVAAVNADTVVRMRPGVFSTANDSATAEPAIPAIVAPNAEPGQIPETAKNYVRNPEFHKGKLKPWTTCASSKSLPLAEVTREHPYKGHYDAYAGTYQGQAEPNGTDSVCQLVAIPNNGSLTAWTWGVDNDRSHHVYEFAALFPASGGTAVATFFHKRENDGKWIQRGPYDLSAFAGQSLYLAFGVVGDKADKGKTVGQYLGEAVLTGSSVTPTPMPNCPTTPNATPTPNFGKYNGWGPASVNDGLQMPYNYGCAGAGQTAAIVIDAEVNPSDLQTYLSAFGITQTGTVSYELLTGASSSYDTDGEASLDLETISGLAPQANVIVYVMASLSYEEILDAYNQVLSDNKATVINSSFGGCETQSTSFDTMSDAIAEQGAMSGITFSASTGDQGSDCYDGSSTFPFGVQAPASDPHFVGVGGTQSTSPGTVYFCDSTQTPITNPAVWNDCVGSGGGGVSTQWTPPPYQVGITGASTHGRNVPDIALPAAYVPVICTGCALSTGPWDLFWGTSWASPTYVAMQTEINQVCGKQWGINTIYNGFSHSGYSDFIDVTSGNNYWHSKYNGGTSTEYYSAASGFDNVSGIGIPLGMPLAVSECNPSTVHRR